jgi:putative ABC transport system permease protein
VALWESSDGVDDMHVPGLGTIHPSVSPANLADYNRQSKTFVGLASYNLVTRSLTQSGQPETLTGEAVTWNYFEVLGMPPALGRAFRPEEDRADANRVVIITDELWRTRFAGNPSIVGRQIVLDDQTHDVIGVMPPKFEAISAFRFPAAVRFLVPRAYEEALLVSRGNYIATVIGRTKQGVSLEQAQTDLDAISLNLATAFPATNRDLRARIAPLQPDLVRHVRKSLLILAGAAGLVLLVACVNVANLLLVRALGQRRDVAIRMALGASRGQILLELLMRGVVLGVVSGAAGLLCGVWTRDLLVALAPATIPRLQSASLSGSVLAATAAVSIFSGVLAGLIPALQASTGAAATLRQSSLAASSTTAVNRWRGLLVATEIAAAVVLATGAGLLVRSLVALHRVPLGYDSERVLVMDIQLPASR